MAEARKITMKGYKNYLFAEVVVGDKKLAANRSLYSYYSRNNARYNRIADCSRWERKAHFEPVKWKRKVGGREDKGAFNFVPI